MSEEQIKELLCKHDLPTPEGTLRKLVYQNGVNAWWLVVRVETNETWLWFDDRTRKWMPSIYGPY